MEKERKNKSIEEVANKKAIIVFVVVFIISLALAILILLSTNNFSLSNLFTGWDILSVICYLGYISIILTFVLISSLLFYGMSLNHFELKEIKKNIRKY